MRFLVENQLPPSLARWLRDGGHDAEHVSDSGLPLLDDRALWARALACDRIVVSKAEDFRYLTNQPCTVAEAQPQQLRDSVRPRQMVARDFEKIQASVGEMLVDRPCTNILRRGDVGAAA